MKISEMFSGLFRNLRVDNDSNISGKYGELTTSLNRKFRNTDSKTANSLRVGSYGRWSAIKGISDLDMLYIMPQSLWSTYKDSKQSLLLSDTKAAIESRYPKSDVRVDRLVVTVFFSNFHFEVQPVFEQADGSFLYPDTYNGGRWKVTKPKEEISAMKEFVEQKNNNLRLLCRLARAWKNKHGVGMGGLLIDTLAHNYLKSTTKYDNSGFGSYGELTRDFFEYLMNQPNQNHYKALGSGQNVRVKKRFQAKAKRAYNLSLKAIDAGEADSANEKWKKIFGRPFPSKSTLTTESKKTADGTLDHTEEFIEDKFSVDIRHYLNIDCEVSQHGFRESYLTDMLLKKIPLLPNKKLLFTVSEHNVPQPYQVYWKVLNRGAEATRRNCIRGQILRDEGFEKRKETTNFVGEHIVECYIVKNGVVVAKDRIDVPIR